MKSAPSQKQEPSIIQANLLETFFAKDALQVADFSNENFSSQQEPNKAAGFTLHVTQNAVEEPV
jgi:hypothetical protein